ncbi:MAG: DUF2089 domain-containing protein [Candidatus Cloacimonetes bacterium]|nr:DUF2089 domain-containing protein [Candidatus Cloacimonadota bacterium]
MNKRIKQCPVCNETLEIVEYHCPNCDITIRGKFQVGELASLSPSQQQFVKVFLCCQGNIKEVEKSLSISYPTVKNRLAEITQILCPTFKSPYEPIKDILCEIDKGNISVKEALKKIKEERS